MNTELEGRYQHCHDKQSFSIKNIINMIIHCDSKFVCECNTRFGRRKTNVECDVFMRIGIKVDGR